MAHQILLEHNGILRVRYSGQVGIGERRITAERVLACPAYADVNRFLLDYRLATHLPASLATSRSTARYLAERLEGRDARVAWLVTYDHQLGADVERLAREFGVVTRRFHDYDAATTWLSQADPDATPTAMEPELMGIPAGAPSPPRRALVLAMEACEPFPPMSPLQFAALVRLVQELLDEGIAEARVRILAGHMVEVVHGGHTPGPSP